MEDDLQSTGLSRGRVALSVGPRCLLRPDPPPLFRLLNTPPLIFNNFLVCLYHSIGTHCITPFAIVVF